MKKKKNKDKVFVIGQKYIWKDKHWSAPLFEVSVVAQYFGKSDGDDDITELCVGGWGGKDCTVLVRNESTDLLYWVRPIDLVASAEQRRGAQLKPSDFADSEG